MVHSQQKYGTDPNDFKKLLEFQNYMRLSAIGVVLVSLTVSILVLIRKLKEEMTGWSNTTRKILNNLSLILFIFMLTFLIRFVWLAVWQINASLTKDVHPI